MYNKPYHQQVSKTEIQTISDEDSVLPTHHENVSNLLSIKVGDFVKQVFKLLQRFPTRPAKQSKNVVSDRMRNLHAR
jgi:hypothetical protein